MSRNFSTEGACCPYCGYLNKSSGYYPDPLMDESTDEYCCKECNKEFLVDIRMYFSYTTKEKE